MATYEEIIGHIKKEYGYPCKTCWIAHMKEVCGLPVEKAHNRKDPQKRQEECPKNKKNDLIETFRYFKMI